MTKLTGNGNGKKRPEAIRLIEKVGVRPSSRRAKLLTALVRHRNQPTPVRILIKEVYGRGQGDPGSLYMVMTGLTAKMKKAHVPFIVKKARVEGNVTYGMFPKGK